VRYLSPAEEQDLRAVLRADYTEHEPEFDFAVHTGLRRSEQYRRISWCDIKFGLRDLYAPRSKKIRNRHTELNDTALNAFRELHRRTAGKDPIFANQSNGEMVPSARHWFGDAINSSGINDFHLA